MKRRAGELHRAHVKARAEWAAFGQPACAAGSTCHLLRLMPRFPSHVGWRQQHTDHRDSNTCRGQCYKTHVGSNAAKRFCPKILISKLKQKFRSRVLNLDFDAIELLSSSSYAAITILWNELAYCVKCISVNDTFVTIGIVNHVRRERSR